MNADVANTIKAAKQSVSESAKYVPLPPRLCSLMNPIKKIYRFFGHVMIITSMMHSHRA